MKSNWKSQSTNLKCLENWAPYKKKRYWWVWEAGNRRYFTKHGEARSRCSILLIQIVKALTQITTNYFACKFIERPKFFYSDYPAFRRKRMQKIWLCQSKHVHCLMANNIRALWYHPSGTFYGQLENIDIVPYVRISRKYDDIWILWSNVILSHPDSGSNNLPWRRDLLIKFRS